MVLFPVAGCLVHFFITMFFCCFFIEIRVFNANSVDPDQTMRSVPYDLGLRCLSVIFWGFQTKIGTYHGYLP